MKRKITLLLLALLPLVTHAAVEIDHIWYNLIEKGRQAEVTSMPDNGRYSGDINIPPTVSFDGKTYDVTYIRKQAFLNSNSLNSVIIPNSVTTIDESAFSRCTSLSSVTIGNSVTYIGNFTFYMCSSLTSITIPNSVTYIGQEAFEHCIRLNSVTIPNSVTNIGNYAFGSCSSLTSITIPNSVTTLGYRAFYQCSSLASITISNSVTDIGSGTFYECSSLTSVTIPNSVTEIAHQAFAGCTGLTTIYIGSGVSTISEKAFANCPELTDVYCYAENVPSTNTYAFEGSYIEASSLHVPSASVDAYKAVEPWKNFKEIVVIEGTTLPESKKCATPTIVRTGSKLKFECETPDATFTHRLTSSTEAKEGTGSETVIAAAPITYTLTVTATAEGYEPSDPATLTFTLPNGDTNGDGAVNSADIQRIYSIMAAE